MSVGGFVRCRPWNAERVKTRRCAVCDYWDKCMKRSRRLLRSAKGRG